MRSGKSLATCFLSRRSSSGRSLADSRRRAMRCAELRVLAARLVGFEELFLVAQVAGLDEIHDAPQIEQPVFQRRAGQRQPVFGFQLLD